MDAAALYREEMFTDRKVGAIRRLTPVTGDGVPDTTRPVVFIGQAEIMTNMGPVPLSFEIEGKTLDQAVVGLLLPRRRLRSSAPCNRFRRCAARLLRSWSCPRAGCRISGRAGRAAAAAGRSRFPSCQALA